MTALRTEFLLDASIIDFMVDISLNISLFQSGMFYHFLKGHRKEFLTVTCQNNFEIQNVL